MIESPRAGDKAAITPESLDLPDFKNWWGQLKMNGQYMRVTRHPDGRLFILDRRGNKPKNFLWTKISADLWKRMPSGTWIAEYLNAKVSGGPKDTWYVHDVLDVKGKSMLGRPYAERLETVALALTGERNNGLKGTKQTTRGYEGYIAVEPNLWLPTTYTKNFQETFWQVIKKPEVEGLVLKNPLAPLTMNNKQGWTVKSRKPHGNYVR